MQNDIMKKLQDFFIKYKRYIGAVVLLIVFIVVLVFFANPKEKNSGTNTQTETEQGTLTTEYQLNGKLEKNADPELVSLLENYYTAYASGDVETLETIAQPFSDNEKSYVGTFSDYYEKYEDITSYSMQGATEDSYLVSVCYNLKFYEVDTPAPGMDFLYVERDGKGNLCVNNAYSSYNFNFMEHELDDNLYSLILSYRKSNEVVSLQQEVQNRYDEAVKSDEKLANMVGGTLRNVMSKWMESIEETSQNSTEAETQTTEDTQTTEETQATEETQKDDSEKEEESDDETGTVKTKDICNVRKEPSTDAELLGKVDIGVKLKKLGTEGDWTKVEFQDQVGYIKSDLLKTVKKKS